LPDGETSYSVITGDELLFRNDGRGQTLAGHGSNMLMLIERTNGRCWMQPDAEISQSDAELGISSRRSTSTPISNNHRGGSNFGLFDGGVTFISETIAPEVFRELINGTAKERP
jgi:hypothetical protein